MLPNDDNWIFGLSTENLENPALYLGIPNEQGIFCYYEGTPDFPPTPTPENKRKKFNFLLLKRKNFIKYY